MPIAACIAKKELMNQWETGAHGGTYGGNPVACAAALATLEIVSTVLPSIPTLASFCKDFLMSNISNHKNVGDIRVEGLMVGIEFVKNKQTKVPNTDIISYILHTALEKKLILISCGIHFNVIRLAPPLTISQNELSQGLTLLCEIINDYNQG